MRISFVVPQGAFLFGFIGPATVFTWANKLLGDAGTYETQIISASDSASIISATGLRLQADRIINEASGAMDTLIVTGSVDLDYLNANQNLVSWVKKHASSVRRCASVCTGAFILAAAGLLDGLHATTQREFAKTLAEKFPAVQIDAGQIFTHEGKIWTSAGMSAGIDMALAMVAEDHGQKLAKDIAREMNFKPRPDESEVTNIMPIGVRGSGRVGIQDIQVWVKENVSADLSVKSLADHARMSVRNFTRVFQAECGITPARFVDTVRVDAARQMLENSRMPLKRIATACGFVTIGRMRRAFRRHMSMTPQDYRVQLQTMLDERERQVGKK